MLSIKERELDALVAEKVMGFIRVGNPGELPSEFTDFLSPFGETFATSQLPHYSTDIAAALGVAEKFGYYEIARLGKRHNVYIENNDDDAKAGVAQEDSLPLAICRAALLAVTEKVEE